MRKLILITIAILLVFNIWAFGDEDVLNSGTTSAPFLKIPVGARASAMAGSVLTTEANANSIYWNPANLADIKNTTVNFTHNDWFADISHNYVGFTVNAFDGSLGFAMNAINYPEQDETVIDKSGDSFSTGNKFKPIDLSMNISYGRQLTKNVTFGVTGKYIYSKIKNSSASAMALDIGAVYDTHWRNIKLAFVYRNFGTEMKYSGRELELDRPLDQDSNTQGDYTMSLSTDTYSLPTSLEMAIGWHKEFGANQKIVAEYRFMHQNDYSIQHSAGVEYAYTGFKFVPYLRAGSILNNYEHELNAGIGLNYKMSDMKFNINYSAGDYNRLGLVHKFSLGLSF